MLKGCLFKDLDGDSEKIAERKNRLLTGVESCAIIVSEVRNRYESLLTSSRESDFDSPSWAFKEAFRKGRLQAFKEVLELFDIEERTE